MNIGLKVNSTQPALGTFFKDWWCLFFESTYLFVFTSKLCRYVNIYMYILSKRYYLHVTNKNASPLKNELDKKIVAAYLIYLVVLLYLLHYKYYSLIF